MSQETVTRIGIYCFAAVVIMTLGSMALGLTAVLAAWP